MGAAAVGVLGILPTIARADNSTCAPTAATTPALATAPAAGMPGLTTPMVVYIDNPASGQGVIFVGEQKFDLKNPALIQALAAAIA